ncbi:MAG: hypothetical protein ABSC51_00055 [Gaiellaceae bacterium]
MEFEIIWGGDPEDVYIRTRGVATVEGFSAWLEEGLSDPRKRPGLRVLVDHRQLDTSGMSVEDVERRVEIAAREEPRFSDVHVAVVVRRDVDFGVLRMLESLFEARPELRSIVRVFRSIEKARHWLATFPAPEAIHENT